MVRKPRDLHQCGFCSCYVDAAGMARIRVNWTSTSKVPTRMLVAWLLRAWAWQLSKEKGSA